MTQSETPGDTDLVLAAQHGDTAALGLLLARYEPSMRAVALSILGFRPEADDVVQDAALIALRRLGDLRDPAAVGSWLRSIVRNGCRMQLRAATPVPVPDIGAVLPPDLERDPAALVDRHAHRDWVWTALEELSPPLRLVAILRYFTAVTSYEQLAQVCGIPVGTVRSRLSQARGKLHAALLATAELAHDDAAALARLRRAEAQTILGAAQDGSFGAALAAHWHPSVETTWPHGIRTTGFDYLIRAMDGDLGDGVRQRLTNVVASRDVVIWETDLISPPDDPFHCPPAVTWVQSLREGRTHHVRLFHPIPRSAAS